MPHFEEVTNKELEELRNEFKNYCDNVEIIKL